MNLPTLALLAVLSIWDYPARQSRHQQLKHDFLTALREGDTATMVEMCRKGVALLPDDPTWRYNLACSLAYFKNPAPALAELEKAIDLGFRDAAAIAADTDLRRLKGERRYEELVEYARQLSTRPIVTGPLATVDATGLFGTKVVLGSQNLGWDFDCGVFVGRLKLAPGAGGQYEGILYMNRDGQHSPLPIKEYPGLTAIGFDSEGVGRSMDRNIPNLLLPYPLFGNASLAFTGAYWRSIPRALMTTQRQQLSAMIKFYLSNQVWVFPVNLDAPPIGQHGDVFASKIPYCLQTAGRSWSDQYYLRAALAATASFKHVVREDIIRKGMLAPTLFALIAKSLKGVEGEEGYLTDRAHPTALPPDGLDFERLKMLAASLGVESVPPLARLTAIDGVAAKTASAWPELTYFTPYAAACVLRREDKLREFTMAATGGAGSEVRFAVVHDDLGAAKLSPLGIGKVRLTLDRSKLSPTNRVDVAAFARSSQSGWGAPSFVSFAVVDANALYSDPALTPAP